MPNQTYEVLLRVVVRENANRTRFFDLVDGINGTSLVGGSVTIPTQSLSVDGSDYHNVYEINTTFVSGPAPPTPYIRLSNNTPTAGGGPNLDLTDAVIKVQGT